MELKHIILFLSLCNKLNKEIIDEYKDDLWILE